MSESIRTLQQLNKATKLANRAMHKNGPKSYKKGMGALLKVLHCNEGEMSSREIVDMLSISRSNLKHVVRKAERRGYVTIAESDEHKTYRVKITEEGDKIAEKRCEAQDVAAQKLFDPFSEEERAQLNALTEKLIVSAKENGAHGKHKGGRKRWRKHCKKH